MVTFGWLSEGRVSTGLCPIELSAVDHHARDGSAMSANPLCCAVNYTMVNVIDCWKKSYSPTMSAPCSIGRIRYPVIETLSDRQSKPCISVNSYLRIQTCCRQLMAAHDHEQSSRVQGLEPRYIWDCLCFQHRSPSSSRRSLTRRILAYRPQRTLRQYRTSSGGLRSALINARATTTKR